VKVCPAIVSVPVREPLSPFAETEYFTVAAPLPLLPDVTVIQLALLIAIQLHPRSATRVTLPEWLYLENDWLVGRME
jgi:hypothetical protein